MNINNLLQTGANITQIVSFFGSAGAIVTAVIEIIVGIVQAIRHRQTMVVSWQRGFQVIGYLLLALCLAALTVIIALSPYPQYAQISLQAQQAQALYNTVTSKTPDWADYLDGKDINNNQWSSYSARTHEECHFVAGSTYHVFARHKGSVAECFASSPHLNFDYFAYQVKMTILQGDSGGIIFRSKSANADSVMYRFHVTQEGIYDFYLLLDDTNGRNLGANFACGFGQNYCFSSAFKRGINQTNMLTVIATGNTMYMYINNLFVFSASDTNSVSGYIGVFANDYPDSTEVKFSDAKVWILQR